MKLGDEEILRNQSVNLECPQMPRLTEAEENHKNMAKTQEAATSERVACGVCEEDMDQNIRQPVALPACGHTFCRKCLEQLFHTYGQHFRCPTCRAPHQGEDIASLPVNYLVLSFISPSQNTKVPNTTTNDTVKKDIIYNNSPENTNSQLPLLTPLDKMELKNMSTRDGGVLKERDNISLHSTNQGVNDDKEEILRRGHEEDGTGRMRRGCYISGRQKICLLVFGVILVLVGLGAGVAIGSAPAILAQLGFTEDGVAKGTYASNLMSSTARANNGTIPKNSLASWLQQAGHKGLNNDHKSYFGLTGAGIGLATAVVLVVCVVVVVVARGACKRRRPSFSS
ncbi:hypothetical protein Pmani_005375 [Petrolisthes manimaculis]|uniref:RING-type domain-containing protein n=1 Tax=Petrolisthes manimaculis TaxID=1843537 RepID=A0AAE1UGQ3_9EUCA|nr:hypothetical protein Pmani_005375 [Petrolisthes manimaculis]